MIVGLVCSVNTKMTGQAIAAAEGFVKFGRPRHAVAILVRTR
jgi:hypothetical protein